MASGTVQTELADKSTGTTTQSYDIVPSLYRNEDQAALQQKTSQYLFNYGTKFMKDVICGAKGLYVYTVAGHKVLDWTSGQMSCLLGHGHPEIVKTIADHAANLDHLFSGMVSPPVISLGERLCSLLPPGLDKAFFLSTGVSTDLDKYPNAGYQISSLEVYQAAPMKPILILYSRVSPTKRQSS